MTAISTKPEIISGIQDSLQRAQNWFSAIPAKDFFTRQGEVWSASDNVDHMIRAIKPIAKAMQLPKFVLQIMFGKPRKPSKSYDELCHIYREALAHGGRAGGPFLPNQETPENADEKKTEILNRLSRAGNRLIVAVETWDDKALEEVQLPHPLIGKLTLREMLYFTIYHNLRHASQAGD